MLDYYRFKTVNDLFMQGRHEEARLELAALQRRYVALCDENTSLKMQAQEFEDILYLARNLIFDGEFYWLTTGSIRQGPFCPDCYNHDGLIVRLMGEPGERLCTTCRRVYTSEDRREEQLAALAAQGAEAAFAPAASSGRRRARVIPFSK